MRRFIRAQHLYKHTVHGVQLQGCMLFNRERARNMQCKVAVPPALVNLAKAQTRPHTKITENPMCQLRQLCTILSLPASTISLPAVQPRARKAQTSS